MGQSYSKLIYHLVFSTKNHRSMIKGTMRDRLYGYLGGAIRSEGGQAVSINGTSDHIHILTILRQDKAISDVVRNIKATSSGWVHKLGHGFELFSWQAGYGAFTVSPSQMSKTKRYIQTQEEHHKQVSFKEEFIRLLKAHEIEFDERYIWK